MRQFRVTYPSRYPHGAPGHTDLSARQGYYAVACSPSHACQVVASRDGCTEDEADVELHCEDALGECGGCR